MAKRSQVTAKLKIAAEAQLENSKQFAKQLDNILDNFDFGDRINQQFRDAKEQLKAYNKILEKNKNKNLINPEDLKSLEKAGEEIANIIAKTERLYSNLDNKELQKFSKDYIAKVKAQEAEIAKIKQEFHSKTGKNYDEEIQNIDKLTQRIKNLNETKKSLSKFSLEFFKEEEITKLTNQLTKAQENLKTIQSTVVAAQEAYEQVIKQSMDATGYLRSDYNRKSNPGTLEDYTQKQELKAQNALNSSIEKTKQKIEEIRAEKEKISKEDEDSVKAVEKYNKQLQKLEQELRDKQLKLQRSLSGEELLINTKKVTAEYNKQHQIYKAMNDAAEARDRVAYQAGYGTYNNLSKKEKKAFINTSTAQSQLDDESSIENIANTKWAETNKALDEINARLKEEVDLSKNINDTEEKLATQSERMADEGDINNLGQTTKGAADKTVKDVNKFTDKSNKGIAADIKNAVSIKEIQSENMPAIAAGINMLSDTSRFDEEAKEINLGFIDVMFEKINDALEEPDYTKLEKISKEFSDFLDSMIIEFNNEIRALQSLAGGEIDRLTSSPGITDEEEARRQIAQITTDTDIDVAKLEKAKEAIEKIKANMHNLALNVDTVNGGIFPLTHSSEEMAGAIKEAAEESKFLGSVWDDLSNKVGYFLSANYIFDLMTRKIQEASQAVVQMDKDMTQIGLVLGKTSGQIWKNFDTYSQMATRLNTTTSEVTTAMKLFYQQGLNTSEVNKMVEASAIAAALGESTLAEASETLTSIINSYNLTAKEAIAVTDKISQVAIVSAADFNEISIAIEKVASSAASAGLDLDHMMGYLSKMIETTREAPSNIGTALKTIIANFAQFREDPSSLTEDGASMNDVDEALKTVGISLLDTSGEMRDLGEVIDELGKKWDSLSRNQKSYLATMIAGTRQQSRFYALMNDYGRTLELVAASSDSSGKSQQQFALYSNSLEAATSRLNNQWQIFFNEMTKGNGVVAGIVNLLTGLLKIVNKIGPLGSALGLISLVKSGREAVATFDKLNKLIATRQSRAAARDSAIEDIKNADLDSKTKQNKINKLNTDYLALNEKDLANLTKAEKQYILSMEKINAEHARFNQGAGEMSVTLQKITGIVNGFKNKTKGIYDNLIFASMAVKNNKMVKSITNFTQAIKEKFEKIDFSSLKDKFSAFADDAREKAKKISSAITEDLPFYLGKAKDKFKDFSVNAEFAFYKIKDASKMIGQELEFSFYHARGALQNFVNKMPFVWGNIKNKGREIADSFEKAFYELDNKLTRLKQNLPLVWYDLKLLGKKVGQELGNVIYSLKINFKKLRNEAPLIWFNMKNIGKKVVREFDDLFYLIRKGFKSIKNEAPYVWYKLKKTSKSVFSDLNKNFKKLTKNLKTFPKGFISGLNALKKASKRIFGEVAKEANKVGKNKQQQFVPQQNIDLPIDSNSLSIIGKVAEKFKSLANILRDKVFNSSIAKNIEMNQFIKDIEASKTFKERFTEAIDSLKTKMLELKQSGATIFSTLAAGFKVKIKEIGTNIKATFAKLKTNTQKLISDFGTNFKNKIKQIPATFKTAWTKIKTEGLKATNGFLVNFETGIKKAVTNLALGVQLIKVMALELAKTLAITALISTLTKLVSGVGKGIKSALGVDTESYVENAEKAQENAENINSLTSEYEELAKKINKTEEEQERLKEITEEVTKIDAELGRQLKENAENYNANIRAMKEYAGLQEKIAAQQNIKAIKSEASIWNNLFSILDGDLWTSWIGSDQDKELLRDEQFNIWRNLASSRGEEFELDEAQTSMLDKYVDFVIKANQDFGYMTVKANTGEFDDMVVNFINSLQMLTDAQQEQYLQTIANMNNGSTTIKELYNQITNLDVPDQVKQQLWNQVSSIQDSITNAINTNLFIEDKELAFDNIETIAIDKAENLINPDTSTMSTEEKEIYKKDWARFIQDTELVKKYNQAQLEGGDSLKKFTHELIVAEGYSSIFADTIYKMTSALGDVEAFEKSVAAIKSIGDLDLENILIGTISQLDILKEIIGKNLTFEDINYEQGILTISNQTLINKQFEAIEKTFETIEEALDERRENISNLVAQTNTILSEIQTQQDLLYDARDAINLNSQSNFLQGLGTYQDGYTKGNPNDKYIMSFLDIGTSVSKMRKEKSLVDLQEAREYHISNLEKGNEATRAHTRESIQVISSIIAEKTQSVTKYQRGSSQEDAAKYFVEQYQTLQDINNRLKETDKLSQEYFNLTYQSTEISKELQLVLKERPGILSTINGWAQETDKAYNDQLTTHQAIYDELNKQIEKQEEIIQKLKEQAQMSAKWQGAYSAVSTSIQTGLTVDNQLDALKQFYAEGKKEVLDYLAVQKLLTQDFSLYQYLESTETGWKINTAAIEENAKATIDLAISNNNVLIEKAKTALKALESETEGVDTWETSTIDSVGEVINGYSNLSTAHESEVETVAQNLGIEETSWIHWTDTVIKSIRAAAEQYNLFRKNILLPVDFSLFKTGFSAEVLTDVDAVSDSTIEKLNKKKDEIKNALTVVEGNDKSDVEKAKEILRNQIALLEGSNKELEKQKEGIGKYLTGNLYDTEGDSFKKAVDKLEHFYNYLRKIEKLEAKISKLETQQSYADLTASYNIDLLKQENDLLTEKIALYSQYRTEEEEYLAILRNQISSQYKDWAYFTEDGVLQVKQTEFTNNTEEEKKRYDAFKELIDLYVNEYNTALENNNIILESHSQKLSNINEMWEKVNQSIQDTADRLEHLTSIVSNKKDLQFNPLEGFLFSDEVIANTLDQWEHAEQIRKHVLDEQNRVYEGIMADGVRGLLQYNKSTDAFELTSYAEGLLDSADAMGTLAKKAQEWALISQNTSKLQKENEDTLMSIKKEVKDLVDNYLSEGEELLQSWADQIGKVFDVIDNNIDKLETKQGLFGTTTGTLQEQFDAISKAAAIANNEFKNLQVVENNLAKQIRDKYGNFVQEVEGQFFINEAELDMNDAITDQDRMEIKALVSRYNIISETTDEVEDIYYGYLEQIQAMEEEKQDATITLLQQLHDELMEIDQEEVDALSQKYDEMTKLDNEYYSALQQKINDARQNRQIEQEGYNITELQNRLAITTKDTSTAYSADARSLRKELQDALQNRADSEIDREMERIQREQKERQEDRELQIQQMENLITFKDENGIYWEESQALFEEGRVKVESFLASRYEKEDLSQAELQKTLDESNLTLDNAYAVLSDSMYNLLNTEVTEITSINSTLAELSKNTDESYEAMTRGISNIVEQLSKEDSTFWNQLSKFFSSVYDGSDSVSVTGGDTSDVTVESITEEMKRNSQLWWQADAEGNEEWKRELADRNEELAQILKNKFNLVMKRRKDGSWYLTSTNEKYYSDGGYVDYTGTAQVHGTISRPEAFLNAKQTALFENLRNALSSYNSKSSVKTSDNNSSSVSIDNLTISVKEVADVDSIDKITKEVKRSIYNDSTKGSTIKVTRR